MLWAPAWDQDKWSQCEQFSLASSFVSIFAHVCDNLQKLSFFLFNTNFSRPKTERFLTFMKLRRSCANFQCKTWRTICERKNEKVRLTSKTFTHVSILSSIYIQSGSLFKGTAHFFNNTKILRSLFLKWVPTKN